MQPQELLRRIKSKQPPTILDVRSSFEFRNGHISGAVHAPTWKILLRLANVPSDKSAELVVTCEHGPVLNLQKVCLGPSATGTLPFWMDIWPAGGKPGVRWKNNEQ
jgi:hypothetical protein